MRDYRISGWHPAPLAIINLVGILLFASWLIEPTRGLWLALDERVFWAMNQSLNWGGGWQKIWAMANNRAFDLVAAASMGALFVHQALIRDRTNLLRYLALGLFMFITLLVMLQISKHLPIERLSGTAIFPEALRLSELVPEIATKDFSSDSFPGDHGLILMLCVGFALIYLPRVHGIIALILSLLFMLPRLMSGAHWLSDELAGALGLALIASGWLFATPLHQQAMGWFERQIGRTRK